MVVFICSNDRNLVHKAIVYFFVEVIAGFLIMCLLSAKLDRGISLLAHRADITTILAEQTSVPIHFQESIFSFVALQI